MISQFETEEINTNENEIIINYVMSHNKTFIENFLKNHPNGLKHSYSLKEEIRDQIRQYLGTGQLQLIELTEFLNKIEGWGDQHIYLYEPVGAGIINQWNSLECIENNLDDSGWEGLLHQPRPLILPENPDLSSIEWIPQPNGPRLRFIWIEQVRNRERLKSKDYHEPTGATDLGSYSREIVEYQAYRITFSRGLIVFDWDLTTGEAMMLIRKLPRGAGKYSDVRKRILQELSRVLPVESLIPLRLSSSINGIEGSDEVRGHQLDRETIDGGTISIRSAGSEIDLRDDRVIERTRDVLREDTTGLLGDFYWQPQNGLSRELHTRIYSSGENDQRISVWGQHVEGDIRHVIRRIRHHCRATS